MRIGIDASNIRSGGGVTHLKELLTAAQPISLGVEKVTVWGSVKTLEQLPEQPWLVKATDAQLGKGIFQRFYWQRYRLPRLAEAECDLLFFPGGNNFGHFRPVVAMSQNILPFDRRERARYGYSRTGLRLLLLSWRQAKTFRNADGVIFLTTTAQKIVEKKIGTLDRVAVIPHGIPERFRKEPRWQLPLDAFSMERPFRWLYVSIVDLYKHQVHVAKAILRLRREGIPVVLDLIGPAYRSALKNLNQTLRSIDPRGEAIRYRGPIPYDQLHRHYWEPNGFVFASSCENMPVILLEAMAAGLPIACSNVPPMPEVLGSGGAYFNPEAPEEIALVLHDLMRNPDQRARNALAAFEKAKEYTWARCAQDTFSFLASIAELGRNSMRARRTG